VEHSVIVVDPGLKRGHSGRAVDVVHSLGPARVVAGRGFVFGTCAAPGLVEWHRKQSRYVGEIMGSNLVELDQIYHLGHIASPTGYRAAPLESLRAGSLGTHAVAKLAQETGARLLMASTSEVYGDPEVHPQVESYRGNVDPIGPRSCYDESKRYAEAYLASFAVERKVDVRIARIFNTFGRGMGLDDGRMIPAFMRAAFMGEPLQVHKPGTQTRTLCWVNDMVHGLIALMNSGHWRLTDPEEVYPINLGGDVEVTVQEVAGEIAQQVSLLTGKTPQIQWVAQPDSQDPKVRRPDITRAREILNWHPCIGWKEGIARTVAHEFKLFSRD